MHTEKENNTAIPYSKLQREHDQEKKQKQEENDNDNGLEEEKKSSSLSIQRAFLSCDLCAQKMTESYYCPHCLAAYPAHYVKLHTRCTRCVSCPVCTSPLEKIVYSGSTQTQQQQQQNKDKDKDKEKEKEKDKDKSTKKKDVYLYQCPFCFWSSNIVGLEASESEALLENLKEKLKRPVEEKTVIMNDIKNKYLNINEELRKEEDRIEKSKRFHTYKGGRSLFSNNNNNNKDNKDSSSSMDDKDNNNNKNNNNNNKSFRKHRKGTKSKLRLPTLTSIDGNNNHIRQPSIQQMSALGEIQQKEIKKFEQYHVLNKTLCRNIEPPLDMRYVTQFHLRNVSPLQHRLNDPLNQSIEMDKYVPQRFHLMTKESYKCPVKECGKYVCKPTLRGRQANYDKRTAVLDYLPRINIKLISGNLTTKVKSEIIIMVQNRHLYQASFKFDPKINENDLYSTATISCSQEWFTIDPADIHIKGGKQKDEKRSNGDYIKGKEAGIKFKVEPKFISGQKDVKFCVKCIFKTKLQLKDDKSDNNKDNKSDKDKKSKNKDKIDNKLIDTELPYILDFELGPPKSAIQPPISSQPPISTQPSIPEDKEDEPQKKQQSQKPIINVDQQSLDNNNTENDTGGNKRRADDED